MPTTYHDKSGKFTSKSGAHSAVRDGEKLRVVRQLRRLKNLKKESAHDRASRLILQSNLGRMKSAMLGELSAPGFVNVEHVLFQSKVV